MLRDLILFLQKHSFQFTWRGNTDIVKILLHLETWKRTLSCHFFFPHAWLLFLTPSRFSYFSTLLLSCNKNDSFQVWGFCSKMEKKNLTVKSAMKFKQKLHLHYCFSISATSFTPKGKSRVTWTTGFLCLIA